MMRQTKMAIAAIFLSIGAASASQAETLADALTAAYTNSGLLEQNRALLRAADEDLAQAVAATLPVIGWTLNASSTSPRNPATDLIQANAQISASLVLYDGGANQLAVESQKETILGTRESLRSVEQDVLLRAVQAYMSVRRDSEFVSLRQNNVRLITQEFRAAQDRFDVGEVTRTDVALAEARLAAARSQLAAAEGTLARSAEEYRAAVGRMPSGLAAVSPAPVSRSMADAKAFSVRNHPDILQAQHAVSAAELNIRRAEAALKPTVSLQGSVSVDPEGDDSRTIGIQASGPIYNGGRLSSQIRQFMSRRDATRSGLLVTTQGVAQEVGNAYSFLAVARASSLASNQQIRAAQVAFDGVREEATLGSRTTLDVLNAEQELLDARANLISAQAEEVIASYSVLSSMGLLNADHLNLPVQQYDPSEYYNLAKQAPTAISEQGRALDRVLRAIGD
ncbi:TolC family outer membrane protein [Yoonia sediminilitoris]|uniref:Outer membrane protein n=1 Tax=Yoonia sediminilitoris TaxID=1286148 RepID=A0A2T6KBA5_9RHOB|nr:TolC family outer membrane protein [Yoonia sediminilitoris]PUB12152.1 outer membrane protein [Yoonia sediminilitoris]RCW92979.1 outer membrane protein [Yoonia sediminilitoris]